MNDFLQLAAGETVVFAQDKQVWLPDAGLPLSVELNARAKLKKPVNFYALEGVRSHAIDFEVIETFQPTNG